MWDAHVGSIPLCRKSELIDAIRDAGEAAKLHGWDNAEFVIDETQADRLRGELSMAILNDWKTITQSRKERNLFTIYNLSSYRLHHHSADRMWKRPTLSLQNPILVLRLADMWKLMMRSAKSTGSDGTRLMTPSH